MGLTPDLMNENCDSITSWTDGDIDTAVSEVDPAGQYRFDTNTGAAGNAYAYRYKTIASPSNKFTIEIETYFDLIGAQGDNDWLVFNYVTATWKFQALFASDGLFIYKDGGSGEVGADLVVTGGAAAWQTWRFQIDKSGGDAAATVEVFLNGVSQATVDCDVEGSFDAGKIGLAQYGFTTNDILSHIDYIRIATGLGEINDVSRPQVMMF